MGTANVKRRRTRIVRRRRPRHRRRVVSRKRSPTKVRRATPPQRGAGAAGRRYQRFHGVPGKKVGTVKFVYPRRLILIGRAVSVVYQPPLHSQKFFRTRRLGKAGQYIHRFGSKVSIYTTERGDAAIILGGKFRVTDWLRG